MNKEQVNQLADQMRQRLASEASEESKRIYFSWENVFASMYKYPEKVTETNQSCESCGGKVLSIYFSSPEWTWKRLCGRAGTMLICPTCMKKLDFRLEEMN